MDDGENVIQYLFEKDEISIILKFHLHVEQQLDFLIGKIFPYPEMLFKKRFIDKVDLLRAVGALSEDINVNLLSFNRIRNNFSHKYKYELTKEDLDFFRKLGGLAQIQIPDSLKETEGIEEMLTITRGIGVFSGYLATLAKVTKKLEITGFVSEELLHKETLDFAEKNSQWLP